MCFCSGSNNVTKTKTMPVLFRFCAQPDDNMQQHNMKHDSDLLVLGTDKMSTCYSVEFVFDLHGLLASFFFGVYSWLVMNFNYLILWVRVKGQG